MKKKLAVVVTMAVVLMTGCGAKENKTANNTEVPVTEAVADTEEPAEQETVAGTEAKASAGEIVIASNTDTGVAAEEVATKETADTVASGNKTSGNKSNTSSGAAATSTSTNSNSNSGNTGSGSSSGTAHKHTWVAHEGSGHYETQIIQEAWDEPVYETQCKSICNQCGADITGNIDQHFKDSGYTCGGYHAEYTKVQTGSIHHDAETTQVWVQDVAPYAQCSECGEIGPVGAGISFN